MINKNTLMNTRKNLIVRNTLVVFIVFLAFSVFIYGYFKELTFKNVDQSLYAQGDKILSELERGTLSKNRNSMLVRMIGKASFIYIWEDGEVLMSQPEEVANSVRPYALSRDLKEGISSYSYEDFDFRQLKQTSGRYTVEVIKIVNTEQELLNQLKNVLITTTIIALGIVYIMSRFLTKKAMEPIEKSWENQVLFVQDASHELRTPLSIVFSKVEGMLKRPESTVENETENLVIIMKELRRLRRLVGDLLKLTKEDAIVSINKSKVDVAQVINDIVLEYEDICELQDKELKVKNLLQDNLINTDREKLKQVLVILIDNSIKYTREGDKIEVIVSKDSQNLKVEIKDTGIGIKEEELPMIFNRFYRGTGDRELNKEGSGIGLSIASILVSNLNGSIEVKSKYNEGTSFILYIPKK